MLFRFCELHGVPTERCGKLVVATREEELPALAELERRGRANGLTGLRRVAGGEMAALEPHARGLEGLWVPETGIVDYRRVAGALVATLTGQGVRLLTGWRLTGARRGPAGITLETTGGALDSRLLVNCAGLHSDRVARLCGLDPAVRIVPFRGEYYALAPAAAGLVRNLIYPVPDSRMPFLGVHFTRRIDGTVEAGPNAVLALARHGYSWASISLRDSLETLRYPGFWRLARRFWRTGLGELHRSLSRRAFAAELRRLLPELAADDLRPAGAGVRAQAVTADGTLVDDFVIEEDERAIHVLNAPSPGATAALAIGEQIALRVLARLAN